MHQTNFIDRVRTKSELIKPQPAPAQSPTPPERHKPGFIEALNTEIRPMLSEAVWMVALSVTFALPAMLWLNVRPAYAVICAAIFILCGMVLRPTRTK